MTVFNLAQEDQSTGHAEAWASPATKQYASLSREHSLELMQKLATDDGYRSRFEQRPAAALAELGVPDETIANLNPLCLVEVRLADKERFVEARKQLGEAAAHVCVGMNIPTVALDFGSKR